MEKILKVFFLMICVLLFNLFFVKNVYAVQKSANEIIDSMGAGYNIGGALDNWSSQANYESLTTGAVITREYIEKLKSKGFKSIRIPIAADYHLSDASNYKIDNNFLNRIKEVIDIIIENDMYVIIDNHFSSKDIRSYNILLGNENSEYREKAKKRLEAYWTQYATLFKDYDQRVIYEIMNEPFNSSATTVEATDEEQGILNSYSDIAISAIRSVSGNENKLIIVPSYGNNYSNNNMEKAKNYISSKNDSDKYLALALHIYSPQKFAILGLEYGGVAVFSDSEKEELNSYLANVNNILIKNNIRVLITEFGAIEKKYDGDSSNTGYNDNEREKFALEYAKLCQKYKIPYFWWDNGWDSKSASYSINEGYKLIDRTSLVWYKPNIASILTKNYYEEDNFSQEKEPDKVINQTTPNDNHNDKDTSEYYESVEKEDISANPETGDKVIYILVILFFQILVSLWIVYRKKNNESL